MPRSLAQFVVACSGLALYACAAGSPMRDGQCAPDTQHTLSCSAEQPDAGLYTGYLCTGSARPDDEPHYLEHVPQGIVCAKQGEQGYCCTARVTTCAYNSAAICEAPSYGYQCRGANRPDALNAALSCGNGVREGELNNYCCSATTQQPACVQSDSVSCSPKLSGWTCQGDSLPKSEQLGASKSRTDLYRLLCSIASPAANPGYNNYCCYPPAPLPARGSCVGHSAVPGCAGGRFGFACYGPDKPHDSYLPMRCTEPPMAGVSAEGYSATLYCCDFD